jgi:hypothetical protein
MRFHCLLDNKGIVNLITYKKYNLYNYMRIVLIFSSLRIGCNPRLIVDCYMLHIINRIQACLESI